MKCLNNKFRHFGLLCLTGLAAIFMAGCGSNVSTYANPYSVYYSDYASGTASLRYFAQDLCVTEDVNFGTASVNSTLAESAGVFDIEDGEVVYSQNMFQKMYPASTTKILTAYIILKYGNLDDEITVSYEAAHPGSDSSRCGLKTGDMITVGEVLYGMVLESGNDAAIALSEYYAGSIEAFAEVMNEEALKLGATHSHFTNPSGLPDENHYTTLYDMYLILQAAVQVDGFTDYFGTAVHEANYYAENGAPVTKTWKNTCRYLTGETDTPEGFTILAAKTGTTNAAGYCLCLYSENEKGKPFISIVYKAEERADMYVLMGQILKAYAN